MNSRILFTLAAAIAISSTVAVAQDNAKYVVNFRATCRTTTESGKVVTRVITTRDIIRDCAERAGLGRTNLNRFLLIYDVNSDFNGDTIKVVRREDGGAVCQPFRVLFQKSITDGQGPRDERIGFIFNGLNTDPMGSVIVTVRAVSGRNAITGKFQMYDEVYFPERKGICTGNFVTGRAISWE